MDFLINAIYLIVSIMFIFGLRMLSSPKTARRGNMLAGLGMLIAIVVTLADQQIVSWPYIIVGLIIGAAIGAIAAKRVELTQMPQMVAAFNGLGGGASAFVAFAELGPQVLSIQNPEMALTITIVLSVLIGTVTLTGSAIAFAKLQGLMTGAPIVFPMQKIANAALLLLVILFGAIMVANPGSMWLLIILIFLIAGVLGVTSVIPIGGADMPVVIALLNSYSGLAASATGFVISNNVLIIGGALVGASGLILSKLMCVAMNRSLANVLFAAVGTDGGGGAPAGADGEQKTVTKYTTADAAAKLKAAKSVIIVPGYGLAAAQAQHTLHEGVQALIKNGTQVRYAIHPVAGRMPGHMNVLLAEANVPYDLLFDMDEINDDFQDTDVALVIGANDVINPAARYKKNSPLYGMPILNVDHAKTVIICKRSLSPGFAGEDNELFYDEKTMMCFGDAKKTVSEITDILKGG